MKVINILFKNILFIAIFYLLMGLIISDKALSYDFSYWEHGASGYEYAIATVRESPLILYFHEDPSKWSKKMNTYYLASYEIEEFLGDIAKVEINPDKGAAEEALCAKYGVVMFPSFLIFIPAFNGKPERIHPFSKGGNMTIDEFLYAVRKKIETLYNNKGYSCFKNKEYEEALKYYEMAIDFYPESVYAYFGMGIVYHTIAFKEKNLKLLEKAEKNYLKALKIDPNHQGSKEELKKVRKAIEKAGKK